MRGTQRGGGEEENITQTKCARVTVSKWTERDNKRGYTRVDQMIIPYTPDRFCEEPDDFMKRVCTYYLENNQFALYSKLRFIFDFESSPVELICNYTVIKKEFKWDQSGDEVLVIIGAQAQGHFVEWERYFSYSSEFWCLPPDRDINKNGPNVVHRTQDGMLLFSVYGNY
jgi:hypothetical protein